MTTLHIISAGAMQAVVSELGPEFAQSTGAKIEVTFGAVGQQKARVLAGETADVILLTPEMLEELSATGWVVPGSAQSLGRVGMGVVVPNGHPPVDLSTVARFREALLAASLIVYPDPAIASAGRNFDNALLTLGIRDIVAGRIRHFPNGNVSMTWLGEQRIAGSIGVTQVSEIKPIPTITLIGEVPAALQVVTEYGVARAEKASAPDLGALFFEFITSTRGRDAVARAGFAPTF